MNYRYKFIEIARTRHGKQVVYFRKGAGKRHRLPPLDSIGFREAYMAALNGNPIPYVRDRQKVADIRRQAVERALRRALPRAKRRDVLRNREHNLSIDWLLEVAERQCFRCALTGIPFYSPNSCTSAKNPFAPSIDRIDCTKGYTTSNVRLVVFAVNAMLMDWGEPVFKKVAEAYLGTKRARSIPAP